MRLYKPIIVAGENSENPNNAARFFIGVRGQQEAGVSVAVHGTDSAVDHVAAYEVDGV